jgi:hypothetical protein
MSANANHPTVTVKWQRMCDREVAASIVPHASGGTPIRQPLSAVKLSNPSNAPMNRGFFDSITGHNTPAQLHPLWRIACGVGHGFDRLMNGMRAALLVFYASLGLTAFPLLANAHWVGGIAMAIMGSMFGWLLFARCQPRATPVDDDDSEYAAQYYRR